MFAPASATAARSVGSVVSDPLTGRRALQVFAFQGAGQPTPLPPRRVLAPRRIPFDGTGYWRGGSASCSACKDKTLVSWLAGVRVLRTLHRAWGLFPGLCA